MNTIKQYGWLIAAALLVLAVVAVCLAVARYGEDRYQAGVAAGKNEILANYTASAQEWQRGQDALAAYSAAAGQKLNQTLGTALPTILGQTHDTVETIRTIYVQTPAPAGSCDRPAGVQQALDEAVDRANAAVTAAGHVRSDTAAVTGGASAAAGDGGGHARQ